MFHGTWLCHPLFIACSWLHAFLRYMACLLMCSGPMFTCGHLNAITADGRVLNAFSAIIAQGDIGKL
jgi:hypothetical protein